LCGKKVNGVKQKTKTFFKLKSEEYQGVAISLFFAFFKIGFCAAQTLQAGISAQGIKKEPKHHQ
jgi:hypothetical protein